MTEGADQREPQPLAGNEATRTITIRVTRDQYQLMRRLAQGRSDVEFVRDAVECYILDMAMVGPVI